MALLDTNSWVGTPAARQARRHSAAPDRVGGVALVGVDLEQRAAVEQRLVGRVVPRRRSSGGRRGRRRRTGRPSRARARCCSSGPAPRPAADPARARRPASGRTRRIADPLPTSSWSKAASTLDRARSPPALDQRGQAGVHAAQVVQPAGGEELPVRPEDRRGGGVVGHQVVAVDVVGRAQPTSPARWSRIRRPAAADAPHRRGVLLLVELQALVVDAAVEVDGQLRDAHDRPGADQPRLAVGEHQPAGQPQLAVQPGVEQRPAVDLDAELLPADAADVGSRLELERRASRCARRRSGTASSGPASVRHPPGEQRAVADQEVTARARRPRRRASSCSAKPAASSRRAPSAAAWNDDGEAVDEGGQVARRASRAAVMGSR